jgi:hypothetical protein
MARARGDYMGTEKEPPPVHGKRGGRRPVVHSHSARPKRSIKGGGRKR